MISIFFIVLAILFGFFVYRRNAPLGVSTIIGVVLIAVAMYVGLNWHPIYLSYETWMIICGVYILIASVTPVWILLHPRDYLSSFLLYGMIGMVGIRIWVEHKVNFDKPVNVMVAAITMIIAVGQFEFAFNGISFNGIAIGTVVLLVAYHGLKAIGKATGTIAKDDPDIL